MVAAVIGPVAGYLLVALILALIPINASVNDPSDGIDIFISTNGVHTDLVLPIDAAGYDWRDRLQLDRVDPKRIARYVAFGWGDRGFYLSTRTWSDLRVATAFRAMTGLGSTVMHVAVVRPPQVRPTARRVRVPLDAYQRLADFVDGTFQTDPTGARILIPNAHYGRYDMFFEAKGHYSIVETCNEWVRRGLRIAGVRVPAWAPIDRALFYQLSGAD